MENDEFFEICKELIASVKSIFPKNIVLMEELKNDYHCTISWEIPNETSSINKKLKISIIIIITYNAIDDIPYKNDPTHFQNQFKSFIGKFYETLNQSDNIHRVTIRNDFFKT